MYKHMTVNELINRLEDFDKDMRVGGYSATCDCGETNVVSTFGYVEMEVLDEGIISKVRVGEEEVWQELSPSRLTFHQGYLDTGFSNSGRLMTDKEIERSEKLVADEGEYVTRGVYELHETGPILIINPSPDQKLT